MNPDDFIGEGYYIILVEENKNIRFEDDKKRGTRAKDDSVEDEKIRCVRLSDADVQTYRRVVRIEDKIQTYL